MIVRPARVDDARQIAAVSVSAWRAGYSGIMPDKTLDHFDLGTVESRWTRNLEEGRGSVIVLEAKRSPVLGFCMFGTSRNRGSEERPIEAPDTLGEVYALNVSAEHWGKGYGTELLACACKGLAAICYEEAELWVSTQALRTRSFYEKCGWTESHETRTDSTFAIDVSVTRYFQVLEAQS